MTLSRRRTESFSDAEFAALRPQEVEQARVLYAEGFFRQLWHRGDVPGACLLIEADSEDHVRERLNTLPLYQAGMLEVLIIPLKPYAGFCPSPPALRPGPAETRKAETGLPARSSPKR